MSLKHNMLSVILNTELDTLLYIIKKAASASTESDI
jgi:hypothetical protein